MKKNNFLILFLFLQINIIANTLSFDGQFISTLNWADEFESPINLAALELHYIPEVSFKYNMKNQSIIDFQYSYSLASTLYDLKRKIKDRKYRSWIRFSNDKLDMRIGLQKIAFGTALFLRPLAWFDSLDFTSLSGQTNGVDAIRFIITPSNSLAMWFWVIENKNYYTDIDYSQSASYGGRVEVSSDKILRGDWGFTYHKDTDSLDHELYWNNINYNVPPFLFKENDRLGIDYRYDGNFGFWIESCYYNLKKQEGRLTFSTLGFDYTIPYLNGILLSTETMFLKFSGIVNFNQSPFLISLTNTFTVFHLSIPINHINNIAFYFMKDWDEDSTALSSSSIVRWSASYNSFSVDYMLTLLPGASNDSFRIMFIYNH